MNADLTVTGALTLGTQINTGANTLGLACQATVSGASASNFVLGNVRKDYCATGGFTYPTGTANGYSPVNANITLGSFPSSLTVKANQGNRTGMAASNSLQRFWTLTESGDLTTNLVFNYLDPTDIAGTESSYLLYRFTGAVSTAVAPFTLNAAANTVSANGITAFSDWTLGNLTPSAAGVSVSGQVRSADGRGLRNATVVITDEGGNLRSVLTSSFGYYRFEGLAAGQSYVCSVRSKRYQFAAQTITLNEDVAGLDFTAEP